MKCQRTPYDCTSIITLFLLMALLVMLSQPGQAAPASLHPDVPAVSQPVISVYNFEPGFKCSPTYNPNLFSRGTNTPQNPLGLELTTVTLDRKPVSALHVTVSDLSDWDTLTSPNYPVSPMQSDDAETIFWARGDSKTPAILFEWDETNNSRWIARVPITQQWQRYVLSPKNFRPWGVPATGDPRGFRPSKAIRFAVGVDFRNSHSPPGPHQYWIAQIGTIIDGKTAGAGNVDQEPLDVRKPAATSIPKRVLSAERKQKLGRRRVHRDFARKDATIAALRQELAANKIQRNRLASANQNLAEQLLKNPVTDVHIKINNIINNTTVNPISSPVLQGDVQLADTRLLFTNDGIGDEFCSGKISIYNDSQYSVDSLRLDLHVDGTSYVLMPYHGSILYPIPYIHFDIPPGYTLTLPVMTTGDYYSPGISEIHTVNMDAGIDGPPYSVEDSAIVVSE